LDIARVEAPGSIGYVEVLIMVGERIDETGVAVSTADCEANIALAQEFVDREGTYMDLTMVEASMVEALLIRIDNECPPGREYMNDPDVLEFLG
jgi:hypothetical protein